MITRGALRADFACRARAYTIIEVVLVIALLLVLASLLWPNAAAILEGDRLPRAGDEFRGLLVGLRQRAIEESRTFTLSMMNGAPQFSVRADNAMPDFQAGDQAASPALNWQLDARRDLARAVPDFDSPMVFGEHSLFDRLRFELESSGVSGAATNSGGGKDPNIQAGEIAIRFYPDGTCDDTIFWIVDQVGDGVRFEVRGLTGVVKVSRPLKWMGTATGGTGS